MTDEKQPTLVIELEMAELACIIAEAITGKTRPSTVTAPMAMMMLDKDMRDKLMAAAMAVSDYFRRQCEASNPMH